MSFVEVSPDWLKSVYFWSLVHGFTCQSVHFCVTMWIISFLFFSLVQLGRRSRRSKPWGNSPKISSGRTQVCTKCFRRKSSAVTSSVPWSELFVTTNTTKMSNYLNCFNPTKEIFFHTESTRVDFVSNCSFCPLFYTDNCKSMVLHDNTFYQWPASMFWCKLAHHATFAASQTWLSLRVWSVQS